MPTSQAHVLDVARSSPLTLDAVDDDAATIVRLQPVDAADQRGFAGTRRAADDDLFAPAHLQVDLLQRLKGAIPLVDSRDLDGDGRLLAVRGHAARTFAGTDSGLSASGGPQLVWPARMQRCAALFIGNHDAG